MNAKFSSLEVSVVIIPAVPAQFGPAAEKFSRSARKTGPVRINRVDKNFLDAFLGHQEGSHKENHPTGAHILRCDIEPSAYAPSETTLTEMYLLMEVLELRIRCMRQPVRYTFRVRIRDVRGMIRQVHARWCATGWEVDAVPMGAEMSAHNWPLFIREPDTAIVLHGECIEVRYA